MEIATALLHGPQNRQTSQLTQSRVKVLVRIRPAVVSNKENDKDSKSIVVVRSNKTLELHPANVVTKVGVPTTWFSDTKMRMFSFDKVFRPRCSQSEIFDSVKSCVTLCSKGGCFTVSAVAVRQSPHIANHAKNSAGYNCCVFAYGCTGSGKTYTMSGEEGKEEFAGIIPRAIRAIFQEIEEQTQLHSDANFLARMVSCHLLPSNMSHEKSQ